MSGLPLNGQLTELGGRPESAGQDRAGLPLLRSCPAARRSGPAWCESPEGGGAIELEVLEPAGGRGRRLPAPGSPRHWGSARSPWPTARACRAFCAKATPPRGARGYHRTGRLAGLPKDPARLIGSGPSRRNEPMSGKIAVVTGAGSGIGRASALALLKSGYKVALAGRRKEALDETAKLAGNNAPNAHGRADRRHQARRHRGAVRQGQGDLGPARPGVQQCRRRRPPVPLEELPYETWLGVVAANLTGPFLCTQEAMKIMKDQSPRGGRIINNGSISAHAPRPFSVAYTSTKHAITGLTKSTSLDGRALRHRLRPDRHRQRRDADDRAHDQGRAAAQRHDRRRAAHGRRRRWPTPSSTWTACRSTPTCSS